MAVTEDKNIASDNISDLMKEAETEKKAEEEARAREEAAEAKQAKKPTVGVSGLANVKFSDSTVVETKSIDKLREKAVPKILKEAGVHKKSKDPEVEAAKGAARKRARNVNYGEGFAVFSLIISVGGFIAWVFSAGAILVALMGLAGIIASSMAKYRDYDTILRSFGMWMSYLVLACGLVSFFFRVFNIL
ncbi:MAG: hypothetical protein PUB39_02765 [Eubacteriales bacterium]|nr:hypothetical protein [Eubacteriales bacterium]